MQKNLAVSILLDIYGNMLTEKQREAIDFYYNEDFSLAEIAENQDISRQGVRDAIKRGETYMNELESALGFAEKLAKLQKASEGIMQAAKNIEKINNENYRSKDISESISEITGLISQLNEE